MISTDQTRRFPITSGQGNTSIMIMYDHNSNVINATAIKSKLDKDFVHGYEALYEDLQKAGITPLIQRLDNEASKSLIKAIEDRKLEYQLAPPGNTVHYQLKERYKHSKIILLQDYTELTTDFLETNGTD